MVKNSILANNSRSGLNNTGTTWLAGSAIYGNGTGVNIGGGTVVSFGDNDFANNGTDVFGGTMCAPMGAC